MSGAGTSAILSGQVAVVSGASRGIGHAILRDLAHHGARVIGTSTTPAGARAIDASLREWKVGGCGMVLDVSSASSVRDFFQALKAGGWTPGILVNNAGITRDNLVVRMSEDEWDSVLETNLSSLYRMCRACARTMMKARAGRIINVSSVSAALGNAGQSNYAAAKAGMEGFTRALARELAGRNITVNAVAPGFIDTDMTRALPAERRGDLTRQIPLGRMGEGRDVAAAVTFLASPRAAYITGQTLHVNGGLLMR